MQSEKHITTRETASNLHAFVAESVRNKSLNDRLTVPASGEVLTHKRRPHRYSQAMGHGCKLSTRSEDANKSLFRSYGFNTRTVRSQVIYSRVDGSPSFVRFLEARKLVRMELEPLEAIGVAVDFFAGCFFDVSGLERVSLNDDGHGLKSWTWI